MTDFKISLPIAVIVGILTTVGGGIIGMKTQGAVVETRINALEKVVGSQALQIGSQPSRNEFQIFRDDLNRQMAEMHSSLQRIEDRLNTTNTSR